MVSDEKFVSVEGKLNLNNPDALIDIKGKVTGEDLTTIKTHIGANKDTPFKLTCWLALTAPQYLEHEWSEEGFLLKNGIFADEITVNFKLYESKSTFRLYAQRAANRRITAALNLLETTIEFLCFIRVSRNKCGLVIKRRCDQKSEQTKTLSSRIFNHFKESHTEACQKLPPVDFCKIDAIPPGCDLYCTSYHTQILTTEKIPNLKVRAADKSEVDRWRSDRVTPIREAYFKAARRIAENELQNQKHPQDKMANLKELLDDKIEALEGMFEAFLEGIEKGDRLRQEGVFYRVYSEESSAFMALTFYNALKQHWSRATSSELRNILAPGDSLEDHGMHYAAEVLRRCRLHADEEKTPPPKRKYVKKSRSSGKDEPTKREDRKITRRTRAQSRKELVKQAKNLLSAWRGKKMSPWELAEAVLDVSKLEIFQNKWRHKQILAVKRSILNYLVEHVNSSLKEKDLPEHDKTLLSVTKTKLKNHDFSESAVDELKETMRRQIWAHAQYIDKDIQKYLGKPNFESLESALTKGESAFAKHKFTGRTNLLECSRTQIRALLQAWQKEHDPNAYELERLGVKNIIDSYKNNQDVEEEIKRLKSSLEHRRQEKTIMQAVMEWALGESSMEQLGYPRGFKQPPPSGSSMPQILKYLHSNHYERPYIRFLVVDIVVDRALKNKRLIHDRLAEERTKLRMT